VTEEILKEGISILGQVNIVEKKLLAGLYKNKNISSKIKAP